MSLIMQVALGPLVTLPVRSPFRCTFAFLLSHCCWERYALPQPKVLCIYVIAFRSFCGLAHASAAETRPVLLLCSYLWPSIEINGLIILDTMQSFGDLLCPAHPLLHVQLTVASQLVYLIGHPVQHAEHAYGIHSRP